MRSQKIRNRAPRPFKKGTSEFGWSGGNRNDSILPPKKGVRKLAKGKEEPQPQNVDQPTSEEKASSQESNE